MGDIKALSAWRTCFSISVHVEENIRAQADLPWIKIILDSWKKFLNPNYTFTVCVYFIHVGIMWGCIDTLSELTELRKNIVLSLYIGWWIEDTILLALPTESSYLFNSLVSEFHVQNPPFKWGSFNTLAILYFQGSLLSSCRKLQTALDQY